MLAQLICDDRSDPSHLIRSRVIRRRKTTPVISQQKPLLDSDGNLVCEDRRCRGDRRGRSTFGFLAGRY